MAGSRFTVTFESDMSGAMQRQQADVARLAARLERLNRALQHPAQRLRPGRPKPMPGGGGDEADLVGAGLGVGGAALKTGHEFSKLTGNESMFLKSLLKPTTRTGGAWDLFRGAGTIAVHDSPSGVLAGVLRAAKGAYDLAGDAAGGAGRAAGAVGSEASKGARLGRHLVGEALRFAPVRVGMRAASHASPIYDAYTLIKAYRSGEIKGTVNKVVTVAESGVSGLMLGARAGFVAGEIVNPAGGGVPGAIIGGTIGALGGIGIGLKAATRNAPAPHRPSRPRSSRLAWLRAADYLRWQTRTGKGFMPDEASGNLAMMMRTIASRPRAAAANLAEPFTRPLASSIQRARKLSADNVGAVLGQLKLLGPQMRQVTASALRSQVATMERHGHVLRGTTRGLVMAINSQWPKIDPASRRAVTQAITHMSAKMADGRQVLNPQAQKLADGIRSAMQGPFGGIVRDFGSVVAGIVSTARSAGSAISSGSPVPSQPSGPPSSPPPTYPRQAQKFASRVVTPNHFGLRYRRGGRIASLVSPGELIVHGSRSWTVPGARTAADNMLTMLPLGASVLTDHGQALIAAGMSLDGALAHQLPHFGRGGRAGRATAKRAAQRATEREIDAHMRRGSAQARDTFESDTSTPDDIAAVLGSQRGRRSGLFAALDLLRSRGDRSGARAIKAQIAAGRQAYQQRQYDQRDAELALDDLALSGSPDDPALRRRKLDHLQGYRDTLAADLDRAKRTNNYAAISDLAARLQAVGESIRELTEATAEQKRIAEERMALDRELAENQRRLAAVAESQPNVLLGGLIAAVNGGIGGRAGLGFQTPSFAGRGARY